MGMAILLTGSAFAVQLPPPFTDCLGRGRTEHDWRHKLTLKKWTNRVLSPRRQV